MAFRKSIRSNYQPPMFCGGFAEFKTVPVSDGSGRNVQVIKAVPVSVLSDSSLPLMSLDDVKSSGKVIKGQVSFAPNDPVNFNSVQSVLKDYVDVVVSNNKPAVISDDVNDVNV